MSERDTRPISIRWAEQYEAAQTAENDRFDDFFADFAVWYASQPWYRRAWWWFVARLKILAIGAASIAVAHFGRPRTRWGRW